MAADRNQGAIRGRILAIGGVVTATLALLPAAILAMPAGAVQTDPEAGSPAAPAAPPNTRVIVQWRRGSDHEERVEARAEAGVTYSAVLGDPSFQLVETRPGKSAAAAARALEEDPAVAVAEPDGLRRLDALPNDPLFAQEWGLRNTGQTIDGLVGQSGNDIDVVPAWERTVGSPGIVVADIDSGYRSDSPDLGPVEWTNPGEIAGNGVDDDHDGYIDDVHGWDFVGESTSAMSEDDNPDDTNLISGGHGVHTAGTIGAAGNNGTGISGVAQNVRIMPLRVCTNEPSLNEARCPNSAIIAAINYAGANGARVANLSLGGTSFNQLEVNAIAANPGTLYVISAGNDSADNDSGAGGTSGAHYPCDYKPATESSPAVPGAIENTICVAALDPDEALASYSDYGTTSVDLGAPGTAVLSTFPNTETLFSDDFETNDFAANWGPVGLGSGFGRAGVGDGPLTSFGMTDTPGAPPEANHTYSAALNDPIAVAPGTGACRVEGRRFRKGGAAPYGLLVDGSGVREFNGSETAGAAMVPFRTVPIIELGGHTVAPFFEYQASAAPAAGDGSWLDDIALRCNSPLTVPPTYSFLEGTSMAAPHVSGAAALLFSLKPTASVTEVREALLDSAAPVAGLAGKTVTGGRVDVAAAMDQLVPRPGEITITEGPSGHTAATTATFKFTTSGFSGGLTTECSLDGGPFITCSSPKTYNSLADGAHEFKVRGEDTTAHTASAARTWTVDATPPTLTISEGPTGTTSATTAAFKFTATDATGPVTTECSLDGAAFVPCSSPKSYSGLVDGAHEFRLRAKDALGNTSSTSRSWTVDTTPAGGTLPPGTFHEAEEKVLLANSAGPAGPGPAPAPGCIVPKLVGKPLGQAKAALAAAGCKLGKVVSPKIRRGAKAPKLVVRSSTPGAGARTTGAVGLTLAPKPPAKHH